MEFGRWLDGLEAEARSGDQRARTILTFAARALDQLRNLTEPPTEESETATSSASASRAATSCGASRTLTIPRRLSG